MVLPLPILVLLVAILTHMYSKLLQTKQSGVDERNEVLDANSIFVVCVSFRSATCLEFVRSAINKAKHPGRLHFAIIEYIGRPEESLVHLIPFAIKKNVSIQSFAISSASTLAHARWIAFREFYRHETICLFLNEINIVPLWDEVIVSHFDPEHVFSVLIGSRMVSVFPIVSAVYGSVIAVKKRNFITKVDDPVAVILCTEDVIACSASNVDAVLKYDGLEMRNAFLHNMHIQTFTTTDVLGAKAVNIKKLPYKMSNDDKKMIGDWIASLQLVKIRLGLTERCHTGEAIAKYGTVQACRLALAIARDHAETTTTDT